MHRHSRAFDSHLVPGGVLEFQFWNLRIFDGSPAGGKNVIVENSEVLLRYKRSWTKASTRHRWTWRPRTTLPACSRYKVSMSLNTNLVEFPREDVNSHRDGSKILSESEDGGAC